MRILLIALLILLAACSEKAAVTATPPKTTDQPISNVTNFQSYRDCPREIKNLYECNRYLEGQIAKQYPGIISREGADLKVRIANGKREILSDVGDEEHIENVRYFTFLKYFPEIQYGLLYIQFYEGGTFDLIDMKTGKRTNVGGDAVLSPDKRRLGVFYSDVIATFSPNVLAVYFVSSKGVFEEFREEPPRWGADDLEWVDSETISFNKLDYGDDVHKEKHSLSFVDLDIAKLGKWESDVTEPISDEDKYMTPVVFNEPEMVAIPIGRYEEDVVTPNGKMVHIVNVIQPYGIGKYEVTQGLWRSVMGVYENPSFYSECGDNCPVERVNLYAVQEFIRRLNIKTGKQYRLPTEVEWEYACRGGAQNRYCGSDNADLVAWHKGNSDNRTYPVGQKQKNGFGLYDMTGNVWEWVDGQFEADQKLRLLRGGAFRFNPLRVHVADRNANDPSEESLDFGFRLAKSQNSAQGRN